MKSGSSKCQSTFEKSGELAVAMLAVSLSHHITAPHVHSINSICVSDSEHAAGRPCRRKSSEGRTLVVSGMPHGPKVWWTSKENRAKLGRDGPAMSLGLASQAICPSPTCVFVLSPAPRPLLACHAKTHPAPGLARRHTAHPHHRKQIPLGESHREPSPPSLTPSYGT